MIKTYFLYYFHTYISFKRLKCVYNALNIMLQKFEKVRNFFLILLNYENFRFRTQIRKLVTELTK